MDCKLLYAHSLVKYTSINYLICWKKNNKNQPSREKELFVFKRICFREAIFSVHSSNNHKNTKTKQKQANQSLQLFFGGTLAAKQSKE